LNKPIPFGKYYLLERINVGGMAEVFKAKAFGVEGFERLVAVKRILSNIAEDEEFITMFIDEAKIAVQLQHANIAQIFDLGKVDDSYFIALEYVHGRDLRAIFDHLRQTDNAMPMSQACFIVMQVCEGLDYAHNKRDAQGRELNLVHRDVSPQNVLIGYDGEIKLVDFGIAKAAGKASKTQAGILKGKFGYMSPEQVRGLPVDRRSDIFSLGIVLYELLTGERLFVGESDFSTLEKVRNVEILPPSSFNKKIPAELERIALKALAKDVEDRYQNAIDLHDDLQAFLYSVGEFYSRKDLSAWMKRIFAEELAEENAKLERYQQYDRLDEPTPAPPKSRPGVAAVRAGARNGSGSGPNPVAAAQEGLQWDDEELETQIFDKAPEHTPDDEELESGDIVLQEQVAELDDKTVAGAPPAELLAGIDNPPAIQPPRAVQQTLLGTGRPLGGPPPGISAFRNPTPMTGTTDGYGAPAYQSPPPPARPSYAQMPAFRQTLSGMPAAPMASPSYSAIPERRPLEHFAPPKSRTPFVVVVGALVLAGAFFGYRYFNRPGKLEIRVKPTDAQLALDGVPLRGTPPLNLEKPPGQYRLSIEREGYVRKDQNLEIQAGQSDRLEIELEPSPDTGFELTSDPPGGLVWLDGQPFTSGDENAQQARTNFKAYRVAPGRHVIEIKGDPRFDDWKEEFYQEPGKTLKLRAELKPRGTSVKEPPKPAIAAKPPKPEAAPPPPETPPAPKPETPAAAAKPPAPVPPPAAKPPETPPAPRPVVAERIRPRPPKPAKPAGGEDVFESETKLGSSGSPAPAAAPPAAAGGVCVISLNSKPWSQVWIDGKDTGKVTPLVDYKVACGKHKVTFKNPEIPVERSENITVQAGVKFKKVVPLVDTGE
jgi:serine/threonine protein kinase